MIVRANGRYQSERGWPARAGPFSAAEAVESTGSTYYAGERPVRPRRGLAMLVIIFFSPSFLLL